MRWFCVNASQRVSHCSERCRQRVERRYRLGGSIGVGLSVYAAVDDLSSLQAQIFAPQICVDLHACRHAIGLDPFSLTPW
jgi:hypothetical protein